MAKKDWQWQSLGSHSIFWEDWWHRGVLVPECARLKAGKFLGTWLAVELRKCPKYFSIKDNLFIVYFTWRCANFPAVSCLPILIILMHNSMTADIIQWMRRICWPFKLQFLYKYGKKLFCQRNTAAKLDQQRKLGRESRTENKKKIWFFDKYV